MLRMRYWCFLIAVVGFLEAQTITPEFRYLYTLGSKDGIHPPRLGNRKSTTAVVGNGEHPYGLVYPVAVATDARNRVWITDSGTASVHVFDRITGAYKEFRKTADGAFVQPSGIARDGQGRIYIVDSSLGSVFVFDEEGEYDRMLGHRNERLLEAPTWIALSEDGKTVYVVDPPRKRIVELNREGEEDSFIPLPDDLGVPMALSVVENQIYVLGDHDHKVYIFSPGGKLRGEIKWDGIQYPAAFAWDRTHERFAVANPRWMVVTLFNHEGTDLGSFCRAGDAADQVRRIDSLFVDPSGVIYVVASHDGKVLVFSEGSSH